MISYLAQRVSGAVLGAIAVYRQFGGVSNTVCSSWHYTQQSLFQCSCQQAATVLRLVPLHTVTATCSSDWHCNYMHRHCNLMHRHLAAIFQVAGGTLSRLEQPHLQLQAKQCKLLIPVPAYEQEGSVMIHSCTCFSLDKCASPAEVYVSRHIQKAAVKTAKGERPFSS